jgi:hypothetical protein
MKKAVLAAALSLFIFMSMLALTSCQNDAVSASSNSIVGTWKSLGGQDSTGQVIDYFKGEVGYVTFLENGTFFFLGFRKDFPQTGVKPSTIEEYEAVSQNSWGRIGTYEVDFENNKEHLKYSYDLNPQNIGHEMSANFKIVADTCTVWFDGGNTFFKFLKVK